MKPGDLVRIISRDGECTGHGVYLYDEHYPVLDRVCPLIFYRDYLNPAWDFWANWYSYAIVHDWIVVQAFLGLALPFLNLPSILFFIDQKDIKIRLKLCAVSAVAMMIGSTAMLLMIRAGIGVGKDMIP